MTCVCVECGALCAHHTTPEWAKMETALLWCALAERGIAICASVRVTAYT